ncbi:uncharacterized protein LOC144179235 [Haemaphysalis longicornis]
MATSPDFSFRNVSESASRVADKWSAILAKTDDDDEQPVIFDEPLNPSDFEDASDSWTTEESGNTIERDRSTSSKHGESSGDHSDGTLVADDAGAEPESGKCGDSDSDDSVASVWEGYWARSSGTVFSQKEPRKTREGLFAEIPGSIRPRWRR